MTQPKKSNRTARSRTARNGRVRTLIIIGGHEDKKGGQEILREVAQRVGDGKLVITAIASSKPEKALALYNETFRELGVRHIAQLKIETRDDAMKTQRARILDDASGLFFTGGDQLKITSRIGDTPVMQKLQDFYAAGGVVAGTSAGAIAMCQTMMINGNDDESHRIGDLLRMAPGLGFIESVIIDPHFSERGRMGRLLGAVAQNPLALGIGIDEDTAIIVEDEAVFTVVGDGAVYIVDGKTITYSNVGEAREGETLTLHHAQVHVISEGSTFDLAARQPGRPKPRDPDNVRSGPPEA